MFMPKRCGLIEKHFPPLGRHTGGYKYYAFCGKLRKNGQSDEALTNLAIQDGLISKNFNKT